MRLRLPLLLVAACAAFFLSVSPAAAQFSNIETVEGPNAGEETTLTISPHALSDNVSARALGVSSPREPRWALTLIGVTPDDSLGLSLAGEPLPIEEVNRPEEGEVGPTRLFVSQETFLQIAESASARLHVGDERVQFPEQMRTEMQKIFDTVL